MILSFYRKTQMRMEVVFYADFIFPTPESPTHLSGLAVYSCIVSRSKVLCLFGRNNSPSHFIVFKTKACRQGRVASLRGNRKNCQHLFLSEVDMGKMWFNDCKTLAKASSVQYCHMYRHICWKLNLVRKRMNEGNRHTDWVTHSL